REDESAQFQAVSRQFDEDLDTGNLSRAACLLAQMRYRRKDILFAVHTSRFCHIAPLSSVQGTMMSDALVKCVPSTMIIGVGCGKSYSISNPTRIFIRNTLLVMSSRWPRKPWNTRLTALFGQMRARSEKAIA